jgi:predicted CoA-binding protein
MKKTLVLGASENPERYSNKAIRLLRSKGHEVVAIGKRPGKVGDVPYSDEKPLIIPDLDTITIYLNPFNQKEYYEYIISLKPNRIIFNPGSENPELSQLAEENGIKVVEACTLVLLSTGQY